MGTGERITLYLMIAAFVGSRFITKTDVGGGKNSLFLGGGLPHQQHQQQSTKASIPVMESLASGPTFYPEVERLYRKYGSEIAKFRPIMKRWCEVVGKCKLTDYEAEMLYMLIRETKPKKVLEVGVDKGYSSHWILRALKSNDETSVLHSFDIVNNSIPVMTDMFRSRWKFTHSAYETAFDEGKFNSDEFDLLFIDGVEEPEFVQGYCRRLFENRQRPAVVAIHSILRGPKGNSKSSDTVYKYLSFSSRPSNLFTMSSYVMPSIIAPQAKEVVPKLNKLRAQLGIVKPCEEENTCDDPVHDFLYYQNNEAPTAFFQIN